MEPKPRAVDTAGAESDHEVVWHRAASTEVPAVTIAVSLGGCGDRILEALESICLQTTAGIDLLVIDRGAPSESVAIALRWMNDHATQFGYCRLLRLPAGGGIAEARDLAFRVARTPFVLVMDADDLIYPRCVQALREALDVTRADFAYCGSGSTGAQRGIHDWRPQDSKASRSDSPIEAMALVRRAAWDQLRGDDEAGVSGILVPEFLARRYVRPSGSEAPAAHAALEQAEFAIPIGETPADVTARLARDDREIRYLRAELDLLEWHLPERLARDGATRPVAPVSDPDLIILARARQVRDRLMPAGTWRRRVSVPLIRAARILAAEGPRPLLRRVSRRLARGLYTASQPPGGARPPVVAAPAVPKSPSRSNATRWPVQGAIPYRPHITPSRPRTRFSLLSSSLGNCFFDQIRDLIAAGIAELGHDVVFGREEAGFRDDVNWHVVVAPHEFFFLGKGEELRQSEWPSNVILVTTEQPSTKWFALAWECLARAHAVWDIDHNTARRIRERGIPVDYLPLGFAPGFADYGLVAELPLHYGTCFLGNDVRRCPSAGGPLRDRPLDLLFVGGQTPRREAFFARAAPALADHRSYIHIFEAGRPIRVGKTTYMDTSTVIGLSQRSKVLLNVHHGVNVYFEWQRIVLQGIWQRTLVVSERCSVAPPFRAGVHYVEADLDQIPRVLRYYLNDPQGRGEAQEIADAGYETLVSECRLSRFLEVLLLRHAASGAVLDHFDSGRLAMAVPEPRAG